LKRSAGGEWAIIVEEGYILLARLEKRVKPDLWKLFLEDFENNKAILKKFNSNEISIKAWEIFKDYAFIRKNENYLMELENVLRKTKASGYGFDLARFEDVFTKSVNLKQTKEVDIEEVKKFFRTIKEDAGQKNLTSVAADMDILLEHIVVLEDIGKITVKELTDAALKHINWGEVELTFTANGAVKAYRFSALEAWSKIKYLVENDPAFMADLMTGGTPGYRVLGMHNLDAYNAYTHIFSVLQQETPNGFVNGRKVVTGKIGVKVPDLDNVRKKGKWTGLERAEPARKKGVKPSGHSSFFPEGMDAETIEQLISAAFRKKKISAYGNQWDAIIDYKGQKLKIHGYLDDNGINITSAFLEKII
jgi:hypothetical protein